ncbi:MAG: malate dehydrogenase [Chitinivibrionales bacterium]|nr:malate dehydrogenase [Chitinivibrionales bacterium]
MSKVSVIGAGQVGATAALYLAQMDIDEVVMVDVVEGVPQGKALDMMEAAPVLGFNAKVTGSNDYAAIEGSDVIIHTAGIPRKPGMDRMDLLKTNVGIARNVASEIMKHCPSAKIIVVANPLDIICMAVLRATGLPSNQVIGQAGVLDGARFRYFIAEKLGVTPGDVTAMVLGGHGDQMVPLKRFASVGGIPLDNLMDNGTIEQLVARTRTGGGEIVKYLKTGSAFYAPAASSVQMAESILKDKKRIIAASAYLNGEYGYDSIFLGVPVVLGKEGIEKIIEIDLTSEEKTALDKSVDAVKDGVTQLDTI